MSEPYEQLDVEYQQIISEKVKNLLQFLFSNLPESSKYADFNIGVNILTGALSVLAIQYCPSEYQDRFINNIASILKETFEINSNNK